MKQRFRIGKISFQDPLILCGALAILLYFDASGFLRVGLLAAVLRGEHFAGGLGCFLPFPAGYHLVECLFCGKFVDRGF